MTTDSANKILALGDSQGFVHLWDISQFCIEQTSHSPICKCVCMETSTVTTMISAFVWLTYCYLVDLTSVFMPK